MNSTSIVYISVRDCPYTRNGENLAAMRRADLRPYAKTLKISADGSKQEILRRVIGKLGSMDAPKELNDL